MGPLIGNFPIRNDRMTSDVLYNSRWSCDQSVVQLCSSDKGRRWGLETGLTLSTAANKCYGMCFPLLGGQVTFSLILQYSVLQ